MEAQLRLSNGRLFIKVEGDSPKDLFQKTAAAHEVFGETHCGLCGSTNIRPVHRVNGKYHFHEYHCEEPGCRARLSLGLMNDNEGNLFPVRKLLKNGKPDFAKGDYGQHNGWTKYKGDPQKADE